MQIAKLAVVLIVASSAFAQSSRKPQTVAQLKARIAALEEENAQLHEQLHNVIEQDIYYSERQFSPVKVGTRTFQSEHEFIEEFNRLARAYDALLDQRTAPPPPIFVTAPELPHIPSTIERIQQMNPPIPLYCSSYTNSGMTQTTCN